MALSEDSSLTRVQQGSRSLPIWPSRHSPRQGPPAKPQASERPHYSRTTSSEGVLLMEQKLREALDRASFECAVVRIENGVYNFGPNVRAVVELTPENEVVACQQDGGDFTPIDEFIRAVAQRPLSTAGNSVPASSSTSQGPSSGGGKASPVDNTVSQSGPSGDASERRNFGPPAKVAQQPYTAGGSPPSMPVSGVDPVPLDSARLRPGHGAVPSTSPRRVGAPMVPSGTSAHPPSVTLGRQAAGTTPERLRVPGQPSPQSAYPAGSAAAQSGGQRMLISPNTGGGVRYGMATLSPGRQMPSSGSVFPAATPSPRLQG